MNHTPVYTFGLGYPPKTKHNLFTFKTQSTMKKINEIAVINSVSLNEKLYSFNEENKTFRVALRITYSVVDSDDNKDNDVISLSITRIMMLFHYLSLRIPVALLARPIHAF